MFAPGHFRAGIERDLQAFSSDGNGALRIDLDLIAQTPDIPRRNGRRTFRPAAVAWRSASFGVICSSRIVVRAKLLQLLVGGDDAANYRLRVIELTP